MNPKIIVKLQEMKAAVNQKYKNRCSEACLQNP